MLKGVGNVKLSEERIEAVKKYCLQDGVVNLDRIQECRDYQAIEFVMNHYPISTSEYLVKLYNDGQIREVFRYGVDHGIKTVVDWFSCPQMPFGMAVHEYFKKLSLPNGKAPDDILCINAKYLFQRGIYWGDTMGLRKRILDDLYPRINFEPIAKEYSKEYFMNLLNNGDITALTLNLCDRLDMYLKTLGGLEDSLGPNWESFKNKAISEHRFTSDDVELVSRFIDYRNVVGHRHLMMIKKIETPTRVELDRLIDLICGLE